MANAVESLHETVRTLLPSIVELRHELHQHPEIRFEETWTSDRVAAFLESHGIACTRGYAKGTGIVAEFGNDTGRTVGLRSELDALEIHEETGLPYASTFPGKMHACGHDGHMACLCGAAAALKSIESDLPGRVRILFQPAEEQAAGGRFMVAEGAVDSLDAVFALHGWPTLPIGSVGVKSGPAMAGADFFRITVHGKGCHAADPGAGVDPIVIASEIVTAIQSVVSREINPWDSAVVTVARIESGHASNVIPETAFMEGTFRTLRENVRAKVRDAIARIAQGVSQAHKAEASIEFEEETRYPSLHNDPETSAFGKDVVRSVFGDTNLHEPLHPTMASEDFSFYLQKVPGTFFFLGCNPNPEEPYPALHNSRFDFPDEALLPGITLHTEMALRFLSDGGSAA